MLHAFDMVEIQARSIAILAEASIVLTQSAKTIASRTADIGEDTSRTHSTVAWCGDELCRARQQPERKIYLDLVRTGRGAAVDVLRWRLAGLGRRPPHKAIPDVRNHLVFSFLTTDASPDVAPIHPEGTPVLLLDQAAHEQWINAPWELAKELHKPPPAGALRIVAVDTKEDAA